MIRFLEGDCREVLKTLPDQSVQCVVTSPPYFGLRSYLPDGHDDKHREIGLEASPAAYVAELVAVFRDVWRVLRNDGICFINLGDSYNNFRVSKGPGQAVHGRSKLNGKPAPDSGPRGHDCFKEKDLMMIPARVAIALCDDGWYLRSQMPWVKRGCMPESVEDRPGNAVEYVYLLTKQPTYFYDAEAVKRQGAIPAGTRAAKGSNVRSALKDVNGRPPEYGEYNGTRNFRNADLFFDSLSSPWGSISDEAGIIALDVNTQAFASAHFAVFPDKLVEPLIKAGTPEVGCCSTCAAPWERMVQKTRSLESNSAKAGRTPDEINASGKWLNGGDKGNRNLKSGPCVDSDTVAWVMTCACPITKPTPCTVLDPFSGSGTSCLVADRLGRNAIGIDLNPAYGEMARERLVQDAGLFAEFG